VTGTDTLIKVRTIKKSDLQQLREASTKEASAMQVIGWTSGRILLSSERGIFFTDMMDFVGHIPELMTKFQDIHNQLFIR